MSLTIDKPALLRALDMADTQELLDRIVALGIEIDESTPEHLIVDITPNRPDLLSQAGFTRALAAFLGIRPGLRAYPTTKSKLTVKVDESCKGVRPHTACAVVKGLALDEQSLKEIIDIQERLHVTFCRKRKRAAIGVYPMEAIKGSITFKALPPEQIRFRPLEADREMTATEILTEHPKGKEYAHLLAGLPRYPVFVDSKGNVLSMPPVINSHLTGKVTTQTTEVFIEASGADMRICHEIVRMLCAALADMGGQVQTVEVVGRRTVTTPDMQPARQSFYGYYVNRRLGTRITREELPELLGRMGLGIEDGRIKDTFVALIPPYRVDFLHQIDVVEDIAIAYGYDRIVAEIPQVATVAAEQPLTLLEDRLRTVLVGYGLLEAKNYHLLQRAYQELLSPGVALCTLASSVSEEYDTLRASILASLLGTLRANRTREYPQRLFEIGRTFTAQGHDVVETRALGIILAGDADYTRARQVVDGLLQALGQEGTYAAATHHAFMRGRCAHVRIGDITIATVGEVAPQALAAAQLTVPAAAVELDVQALADALRRAARTS